MTALKERDKKLLVFLAILLILAVSLLYIILPKLNDSQTLEDEIVVAEAARDEMELKLVQYQADQATYESLKTAYAEATERFYERMENQQIDRLVTGIVLKKGLTSRDLVITGGDVEKAVEPFYASELTTSENLGVYISELSVKCTGTRATLLSLVDLFTNEYPSIRVTQYQLAAGKTAEDPYTLQLGLDVYMCDKVE